MNHSDQLEKSATGITGLDVATYGGLPRSGMTLVAGEAGSGKTVMTLQIAANAIAAGTGVVVMSFDESPSQLRRNARTFPWGGSLQDEDRIRFVDGRPLTAALVAGSFDLSGLVAVLDALVGEVDASWVVLDGIDQVLALEPDQRLAIAEIGRLESWSHERGVAVLLTGKRVEPGQPGYAYLQAAEFLLSVSISITWRYSGTLVARRLRIVKYRGSEHVTDEIAMFLDAKGISVYRKVFEAPGGTSTRRLSSGIPRLDAVLAGGVYFGSTTLLSGAPGTSKTTLASSFALAAAQRGDRVLYVSFDEPAGSVIRNVASVGIDLAPHVESGLLRFDTRVGWDLAPETHAIHIQAILYEQAADMLIIDPVSPMLRADRTENPNVPLAYLLSLTRLRNMTTILTSLAEGLVVDSDATDSKVSAIADNWIALDYRVLEGEWNRTLSVVKARGTAHSNQVRELVLSDDGIDLADGYRYGGQVLLGTARLEAENAAVSARRREERERRRDARDLEARIAPADARRRQADREYEFLTADREMTHSDDQAVDRAAGQDESDIVRRRRPDSEDDGGAST